MIENIFTYNQELGHEIVLVYDGKFMNQEIYTQECIDGYEEEDGNLPFRAVWKPIDYFLVPKSFPLYPEGLLELISKVKVGK
jgi:hypothetical protein